MIQTKCEVCVVLKNFLSLIQNQFGVCVKIVRSDNETEFFNAKCNKLLSSLGILHQSSCPYTPQQNGMVERKHGHILEVARALKFQSGITIKFWSNCVKTAVYLINRVPSSILGRKTHFELLYGKVSRMDHLRVFGCLCYASNLPKGDKFAHRARKAIFTGYAKTQKGYSLYDMETQSFFVSRDVQFREDCSPFKMGNVEQGEGDSFL